MTTSALIFFFTTAQAGTIDAAKTGWTPLQALADIDDPIVFDALSDTTSGTLLGLRQDKGDVLSAITWEFTLEPEELADKTAWLAVADTDTFASVDAFIHDAMRGDLTDTLSAGDTVYGRVAGPNGDGSYIVTGVVGERNHIEGLNALEVVNKGIYTARAALQVGKGIAKISTGNPWGIITGSFDVIGGTISGVLGLSSENTTANGNIFGWDDVEDAIIDYSIDTVGSMLDYLFTEESSDPDADYLDQLDREREAERTAEAESEPPSETSTADDTDPEGKDTPTTGGSDTDCSDTAAEGCKGSDEGAAEDGAEDDSEGGGDEDGSTTYPDFEEDVDPELMAQFLAISAWLGIDPYNTDGMVEAMGYISDAGEKNSVDTAFVEMSWLDFTCSVSTDRCLGMKEGGSTEYANLAVLDVLCEGDMCVGLGRGGTLSPEGLLKLDENAALDASTTKKLGTFEVSRK